MLRFIALLMLVSGAASAAPSIKAPPTWCCPERIAMKGRANFLERDFQQLAGFAHPAVFDQQPGTTENQQQHRASEPDAIHNRTGRACDSSSSVSRVQGSGGFTYPVRAATV